MTKKSPYSIVKVDITDLDVVELVERMHDLVFTDGSVKPPMIGDWWIVYHYDEPVGFCQLTLSASAARRGYLYRAGVLQGHRGHGLQRRMIRVREKHARKYGWDAMVTDTHMNPASGNNLIACGYRLFSPPNGGWGFPAANYWRKNL